MLFDTFSLGSISLANRLVMSPMTRSRAVEHNTPNALMATYYAQRASAGLIIAEGTSPSPNGLGYARIPGLFNREHVKGWKLVTEAVHSEGGKIVVQLMHTGWVTHLANLPVGARVLGPVTGQCPGTLWTDTQGMQAHSLAQAMTEADIAATVKEYAQAAALAMEAGFDGVEVHAANGYLIEQFLNANVNTRTDDYGGSIEGRNRFTLEVLAATTQAIGSQHVGLRLSPYGVFNSTGPFPEVEAQLLALTQALSELRLMYLHVLDHSAMGAPPVPEALKQQMRKTFKGPFIAAGGFDRDSAEATLQAGSADLIGIGRAFLANPDLVTRWKAGAALNTPDMSTFYTADAKGYTDYPRMAIAE